MIEYKKSILEQQSLSEVKMDRGSPICQNLFVKQFQNNVPQCKLAKILISSSVQNIINSSENLEKSLQGTRVKNQY